MRQDNWLPRPEAALWLAADRIPGRFSQVLHQEVPRCPPSPVPGLPTARADYGHWGTRASTSANSGPR